MSGGATAAHKTAAFCLADDSISILRGMIRIVFVCLPSIEIWFCCLNTVFVVNKHESKYMLVGKQNQLEGYLNIVPLEGYLNSTNVLAHPSLACINAYQPNDKKNTRPQQCLCNIHPLHIVLACTHDYNIKQYLTPCSHLLHTL
ncbi:hypothetical protein QYF36_024105 [Acer negundo]|nr:hypothetical protein QYF36_024105 [Acer negundo]